MTGNDSSEACAIACQNCAVYSVFLSGVMSHSKITQFNLLAPKFYFLHPVYKMQKTGPKKGKIMK
jgi:hypothetical protein